VLEFQPFTLPKRPRSRKEFLPLFAVMRAIDRALMDEVWRELTAYAAGRVEGEAQAFLAGQPHVASFARRATESREPAASWTAGSRDSVARRANDAT